MTKRASLPIPVSAGTETLKEAMQISGTFDGGLKTYGRGVSCTGQAEGGDSDAVFILADGATLKNAIIGEDQIEGVHCTSSSLKSYIEQPLTGKLQAKDLAPLRTSGGRLSAKTLSP
jgi:hypothetical protein